MLLQSLESAPSVGGEGRELELLDEIVSIGFSGLYLKIMTLAETTV